MGFIPISIDKYVALHIKNNPSESEIELRKQLKSAINDYENQVKCSCGNDIWVIGSAAVGNGCFNCITGESEPADDYEIETAIKKRRNVKGRRHIDNMDIKKIAGIFDDDGYEIIPELIKKPSLCLICAKDDIPEEELLCALNRNDQAEEKEFKCFAFVKK